MAEFQKDDVVRFTDIPMHGSYIGTEHPVREVIIDDNDGSEFLNLGQGHGGNRIPIYDDKHRRRFELVTRQPPLEDFDSVEDADRWLSEHEPHK